MTVKRSRCRSTISRSLVALGFLLFLAPQTNADDPIVATPDPAAVRDWLAAEILPPGLVNEEFHKWCEPRIPKLANFSTSDEWLTYAARIREETLQRVVFRGIPEDWRKTEPAVVWAETLTPAPEYRLRKLRYEALPGLWIPAILYEPTDLTERAPVALHVNGHDADGKAAVYKQIRSINLAKRGFLVLNVEWLGMGQLRREGFGHGRMNQLELAGVSGLSPFFLAMQRGIDVLLDHKYADPKRVAVSGLSGGGWQTIYLSALDPRVTLANPVAGYSSFRTRLDNHSDLGDSEQTPTDMATIVDYTHLTALRAPRPTLLTYNSKDNCCFASAHALPPLLAAAQPVYDLLKASDRLKHHVNDDPGTHNFERDNREAYYGVLADFFAPKDSPWPRQEIECSAEVKSASDLSVELPESNADFHSLALDLAKDLPRAAQLPTATSRETIAAWRLDRRRHLARIVRTPPQTLQAQELGSAEHDGWRVARWRLRLSEAWTVPVVEITPRSPQGTSILVADAGRKTLGELTHEALSQRRRVLAVDPLYMGESAFPQRAYLFALLAATVGDRPLGIQARQLQCVARWAATLEVAPKPSGGASTKVAAATPSVRLVAHGPRTSLAALVAAALEPGVLDDLQLHGSLSSLHEVLEKNWSFEQAPECFCFGLLTEFDVRSLVELAAPRHVRFAAASERLQQELKPAQDWFQKTYGAAAPVIQFD